MEEVYTNLYVGGDADYYKVAAKENWSCLRCCKYGPGGHQEILGYKSLAAPKGPHYLWAKKGENLMALNLLDLDDPHFVDPKMIETGLEFIKERLKAGNKVLIACNQGHSRGPSVALMFLRSVGDMPSGFVQSEKIFRTLYAHYSPKQGIRQFCRSHWDGLQDKLL